MHGYLFTPSLAEGEIMMTTLITTIISLLLATAATAAPIEESVGVDEGKCEVVSAGNFFCKINGKCYYCMKNKDINPKTDCYKEDTCAAALVQPDANGLVTRPARFAMRPSVHDYNHEPPVTPSVLCQRTE